MSDSARIRSIPALRDMQGALRLFQEDAAAAIDMMVMDLHRAIEWVESDRPIYWQNEGRKAYDLVASTRVALNQCQMRSVGDHRNSCIEEKKAHEAAKRRLQHCQEQMERIRRWSIRLRHGIDEFRGRMAVFRRRLDGDIPASLLMLDRMATALEQYAGLGADIPHVSEDDTPDTNAGSTGS